MEQYADELAEFLDALDIASRLCIAGFSMGGYIALAVRAKVSNSGCERSFNATRGRSQIPKRAARAESKWRTTSPNGAAERVAEMMGPKLFSARALETQPQLMAEIRRVVAQTPPAAIAAAQRGLAARPDVTANAADDSMYRR